MLHLSAYNNLLYYNLWPYLCIKAKVSHLHNEANTYAYFANLLS